MSPVAEEVGSSSSDFSSPAAAKGPEDREARSLSIYVRRDVMFWLSGPFQEMINRNPSMPGRRLAPPRFFRSVILE